MSKDVDQKIVQMKFDNKQFERETKTTMGTLEKLKSGLKFDKSVKSMDALHKVSRGFKLDNIADSLDVVSKRFTTFGIIGTTILRNIANDAYAAGKKMLKALTIDPIKTGLEEYETKINAITTILTNTKSKGTTLDDVNVALAELNEYADLTIYNFAEMTRNIGTFTAAGVDLDTAVGSIKGIANLAAGSGSSAAQAATAMYQLSQAISSGSVKLMDWNSVVNAGMGGELFQNALRATAKEMGVMVDASVPFRETLKDGWLTSKILTETLEGFSTNQDLVDAATQVKTLTQLYGVLQETVQSGWSVSWENIIGDKKQATETLTGVADAFSALTGPAADARNDALEYWNVYGGRAAMIASIANAFRFLFEVLKPIKEAIREAFPPLTGDVLVQMSISLRKFTESLTVSEGAAKNIKNVLSALFSIINIGKQVIGGMVNGIKSLLGSFTGLDIGLGNVIATVAAFLKGVEKSGAAGKLMEVVYGAVIKMFQIFVKNMKIVVEALKEFYEIAKDSAIAKGIKIGVGAIILSITKLMSIVKTLNFDKQKKAILDFSKKLKEGFKEILNVDLSGITESMSDMKSKLSGPANTVKNIFGAVGKAISDFFSIIGGAVGDADYGKMLDLLGKGLFGGVFVGIGVKVMGLLKSTTGFVKSVVGVLDGVKGALKGYQNDLNASALLKIAGAVGILALALTVLSGISPSKLATATAAIATLFAALFTSLAIFDKKVDDKSMAAMSVLSLGLIGMSIAIAILVKSLVKLSEIKTEDIVKGVAAIGTIATILVVAAKKMDGIESDLIKKSLGLNAFATAILIIVGVVERIGKLDIPTILRGMGGLIAIVGALTLFMKYGGDMSKMSVSVGVGLMAVAGAVYLLGLAVTKFGKMNPSEMIQGLLAVGALLVGLGVMLRIMGDPTHMISVGIGIGAIAVSMLLLSKSIEKLGLMDTVTLVKGVAAIAATLMLLAIALRIMPKKTMLLLGPGLYIIALALGNIAKALTVMGGQSWEEMAKSLITLAVALGVIAAAMFLMTGALPGAAALIIVSAALAVLVPVLLLLGSASLGTIGKGLLALAGAFVVIGLAGLGLSFVVIQLLAFGVALNLMGSGTILVGKGLLIFSLGLTAVIAAATAGVGAMKIIATSIIKIGGLITKAFAENVLLFIKIIGDNAPAVLEAFSKLFFALLEIVGKAIPKIVNLFIKLVTDILITIDENLPAILDAGYSILLSILHGIKDNIGELTETSISIVLEFLRGIANKADDIIDAGFTIVIQLIEGIGKAAEERAPELVEAGIDMMISIVKGLMSIDKVIKDKMNEIGENIINGLKEGITAKKDELVNGVKDIGNSIVGGFKSFFDIHSPSKVMEWIGEMIGEGLADGIVFSSGLSKEATANMYENILMDGEPWKMGYESGKKTGGAFSEGLEEAAPKAEAAGKAVKSAFEKSVEAIDKRKNYDKLSLVEELEAWELLQGKYKEGTEERSKADLQVYNLKKNITAQMKTIDEDYYASLESLRVKYWDKMVAVEKAYDDAVRSRADAIYASFALFDKVEQPEIISGTDLTKNLDDQVKALKDWRGNIDQLSERGLGEDLIKELQEMGPSSIAEIEALNKLTDPELDKYAKLWKDKHNLARTQAVGELKEMKADVTVQIVALNKAAEVELTGLKDMWHGKLKELTGKNREDLLEIRATWDTQIKALKQDTEANFEDMKTSITGVGWVEVGRSIVDGMISGVNQKKDQLLVAVKNLAAGSVESANEELDINSPSKKFVLIGRYSVEGWVGGLNKYSSRVKDASANLGKESVSAIESSITKMAKLLDESIDTTPVIRPVIDLTEMKDGLNKAGSLVDGVFTTKTASSRLSSIANTVSKPEVSVKSKSKVDEGVVVKLEQNNYSPKALSRIEIYRQTNNLLSTAKGVVKGVVNRA